jgi:branched-chain amino acid transport system substrate-binding protein
MSAVKIGVLLPKSSLYPSMGFDVKDGLKTRLGLEDDPEYKLIFENIGNGGHNDIIYEKTEKLLLQEEVSAVVAFLDHTAAAKLDPLFAQTKRILIVLDPGAHTPLDWTETSPYRFTLSLQAALNGQITGQLAARAGANTTFFSTSFYEGGYLQCNTYLKGFVKAGGNITYHAIVPFKIEQFNTEQFQHAVNELKPDTVLAQFSAEAGGFFLDKYKASGLPQYAKLYASSFMLEEDWISTIPFPFEGITGAVSWSKKIESSANQDFKETIKSKTGKDANVFSLLGWEAALVIIQLVQHQRDSGVDLDSAVAGFRPSEIESPRGKLSLDETSNVFFGPAYLVEVVEHAESGNCQLNVKEELSYNRKHFMNEVPEGDFSKWTNTYLCI